MWVGGQRHAPAALPPGKTRYPLCRRLGGTKDRSGRVLNSRPPPNGIRSPDRPALSESLYRLSYPGSHSSQRLTLKQETWQILKFCNRDKRSAFKWVKVKWSRYRPGVAQRVGRGIALLFQDRGTRRGWVVSSTPRPHFTPGKDLVPILQEAGWAPGPVWTGRKSRPHRKSIPDRPACSLVAITTELPGPR